MSLSIINQTDIQLSYVNGRIIVPAQGSVVVPQGLVPYLSLDASFLGDISSIPGKATLSDGVTTYSGTNAYQYLQNWIVGTPPQNSNDPISFTLAGMGFSITADATLSSGTETPLLLLRNPNNSTVNARAMYFYAAAESSQGIVTIRIYTNPTISNTGNALPSSNNLVQAGAPVSALNAYASPTISNNGTKRITIITVANGNTDLFNFAQTAILAPGNDLLMTVAVSNLGLLGSANTHFFMQWVEV